MNTSVNINHKTLLGDDYILVWVDVFLKERKAQNLAKGTLKYYRTNLKVFADFLDTLEVKFVNQITPAVIRDFLLILEERGHNPGGVHGYFRAIKAFLKWYWEEEEISTTNPISKVKAPKVPQESIEGISKDEFDKLLYECSSNNFLGERDKAILYVLYDTGVRASELCNILLEDINFIDNSILIRQGKGRKPRFVFFGKSTKKQIRKYLKFRGLDGTHLFINRSGDSLVYVALRQIVRRLAEKSSLKGTGLHDFRRAFTLNCINANIPEITIARLLGHTTTALIGRYAKQKKEDLQFSYKSPVDGSV